MNEASPALRKTEADRAQKLSLDDLFSRGSKTVQEKIDLLHDFIPFLRVSFVGMTQLSSEIETKPVEAGVKGIKARVLYADLAISSIVKSIYHIGVGIIFSALATLFLGMNRFLNTQASRQIEQVALSAQAIGIGAVGIFSPSKANRMNWNVVRSYFQASELEEEGSFSKFCANKLGVIREKSQEIKNGILIPFINLLEASSDSKLKRSEAIELLKKSTKDVQNLISEFGSLFFEVLNPVKGPVEGFFKSLHDLSTNYSYFQKMILPLHLWQDKEISYEQFSKCLFAFLDQLDAFEGEKIAEKLRPLLSKYIPEYDSAKLFFFVKNVSKEVLPYLYEFHQNGGLELVSDLTDPKLRTQVLQELRKGLLIGEDHLLKQVRDSEKELRQWLYSLSDREFNDWLEEAKKAKEIKTHNLYEAAESNRVIYERYHSSLPFLRVTLNSAQHSLQDLVTDNRKLQRGIESRMSYLETLAPSAFSFTYSLVVASVITIFSILTLFQLDLANQAFFNVWATTAFSFLAIGIGLVGTFAPDTAISLNNRVIAFGKDAATKAWEKQLDSDAIKAIKGIKEKFSSLFSNTKERIERVHKKNSAKSLTNLEEEVARKKESVLSKIFNFFVWKEHKESRISIEHINSAYEVSLQRALKNGSYHLFWGSLKTADAATRVFQNREKNKEMMDHWYGLRLSIFETTLWTVDCLSESWGAKLRQFLVEQGVKYQAKKLCRNAAQKARLGASRLQKGYREWLAEGIEEKGDRLKERFISLFKKPLEIQKEKVPFSQRIIIALNERKTDLQRFKQRLDRGWIHV